MLKLLLNDSLKVHRMFYNRTVFIYKMAREGRNSIEIYIHMSTKDPERLKALLMAFWKEVILDHQKGKK